MSNTPKKVYKKPLSGDTSHPLYPQRIPNKQFSSVPLVDDWATRKAATAIPKTITDLEEPSFKANVNSGDWAAFFLNAPRAVAKGISYDVKKAFNRNPAYDKVLAQRYLGDGFEAKVDTFNDYILRMKYALQQYDGPRNKSAYVNEDYEKILSTIPENEKPRIFSAYPTGKVFRR